MKAKPLTESLNPTIWVPRGPVPGTTAPSNRSIVIREY